MSESNVLGPQGTAGAPRRIGGGFFGGEGPGEPGMPPLDDFMRLAAMVRRIARDLDVLIHLKPRLLDDALAERLIEVWPESDRHFNRIVEILSVPYFLNPIRRSILRFQLRRAGLTGLMLRMKEASLYFCLYRIEQNIDLYREQTAGIAFERPILTYPEHRGIVERLLRWLKPGFKTMNSILGSLPDILPGKEVLKELKEHVEAGYEVAGALAEEREEEEGV